jgi:hypothetical protein
MVELLLDMLGVVPDDKPDDKPDEPDMADGLVSMMRGIVSVE